MIVLDAWALARNILLRDTASCQQSKTCFRFVRVLRTKSCKKKRTLHLEGASLTFPLSNVTLQLVLPWLCQDEKFGSEPTPLFWKQDLAECNASISSPVKPRHDIFGDNSAEVEVLNAESGTQAANCGVDSYHYPTGWFNHLRQVVL